MRAPIVLAAVLALIALACSAAAAFAAPASAAFGDRTLREGMSGSDVRALQRKLTKLGLETGVDGFYGAGTKRSMKRWERRADRRVNGVCTRTDALRIQRELSGGRDDGAGTGVGEESGSEAPSEGADTDSASSYGPARAFGSRPLEQGDRGTDVARLQRLLTSQGLPTRVDGRFGSATRVSAEKWEAWQYRRADGVVRRKQAIAVRDLANAGARYEARKHVFPVRGPHSYGSWGSRFGAPRSGHTHQGQDVAAAHGTDLVAAHSGRVAYRQYQAGGAGHYLVIHGQDGSDSVYMHMPRPAIVAPGEFVRAGEKIGNVGSTGASSGPHLHFELWTPHWYSGGYAYDPLPKLQRWDRRT
jgi:murein DD-endopeptidase MepM/ murein hydrolase activator NlpD